MSTDNRNNQDRTAVVFGANGLVGTALTGQLLNNDDYIRVITVTRKPVSFSDPKLKQVLLTDFTSMMQQKDQLIATDYFCCIGTTIKIAGSKDAFRKVDHDIPVEIAKLAETLSIPNMVVISSIGASATTGNFYLRVKGEMEQTVQRTYTGNLKFVRPSLLMGNRNEYRFGEKMANSFMKTCGWLLAGPLKKYRGIHVDDVARSMIRLAHSSSGKIVFESDELFN